MTDASDFRSTSSGLDAEAAASAFRSDFCSTEADGLLGRSVMKWGADGELSALDLQHILSRLSCVDEQAAGLMDCPVNPG